jgi:hypothetical protein
MNYKLLLLTIATLSCGTLSATDETVSDHSLLGSDGYLVVPGKPIVDARDISGKGYELSPDTALTLHVPFRGKGPYPYLKQCLLDPANNEIFNNAKAFGILTDGHKPWYVVLNNNKTYVFMTDTTAGTAPYHYEDHERNIKSGLNAVYKQTDHLHILGYTTNASIISQVFDQIRETGRITDELLAQLNESTQSERTASLATAAGVVVAARADSGMPTSGGASAGAGSGSAMPAPEAVDPRDAEISNLKEKTATSTEKSSYAYGF